MNLTAKKTILLVEDDQDDQELFVDALRGINDTISYEIVANGQEALDRLQNGLIPALIFMDINMPVMNGLECLTEIANNPKMSKIPVVMLSSSIQYHKEVVALGAIGFIEKTINPINFRSGLAQVINSAWAI
jgi:CheY-like chemotaxis protein